MKKNLVYFLVAVTVAWVTLKVFQPQKRTEVAVTAPKSTPTQSIPHAASAPLSEPKADSNPSTTSESKEPPSQTQVETVPHSVVNQHLQQSYSSEDESRIQKVLRDEAKVEDFRALKKRSADVRGPDSKALKAMHGHFAGQLAPSEFNKEPWDIETDLQWSDEGSRKFTAEYEITLSSAAQGRMSRTTGTGSPNALRTVDDDGGLLIEVDPQKFIHAYYLPQSDVFSGNFYSIDDQGATRYHGPIVLTRR